MSLSCTVSEIYITSNNDVNLKVTMYWSRWHYHIKDIAGAPYRKMGYGHLTSLEMAPSDGLQSFSSFSIVMCGMSCIVSEKKPQRHMYRLRVYIAV